MSVGRVVADAVERRDRVRVEGRRPRGGIVAGRSGTRVRFQILPRHARETPRALAVETKRPQYSLEPLQFHGVLRRGRGSRWTGERREKTPEDRVDLSPRRDVQQNAGRQQFPLVVPENLLQQAERRAGEAFGAREPRRAVDAAVEVARIRGEEVRRRAAARRVRGVVACVESNQMSRRLPLDATLAAYGEKQGAHSAPTCSTGAAGYASRRPIDARRRGAVET